MKISLNQMTYNDIQTQDQINENAISIPNVPPDTTTNRSVTYVLVNNTQFNMHYYGDSDIPDDEGQIVGLPGTGNAPSTIKKFSYTAFTIKRNADLHGVEGGIGFGFDGFPYSTLNLGIGFDNPESGSNSGVTGFNPDPKSAGAAIYSALQNNSVVNGQSQTFSGTSTKDENVNFYFTQNSSTDQSLNALYVVEILQVVELAD